MNRERFVYDFFISDDITDVLTETAPLLAAIAQDGYLCRLWRAEHFHARIKISCKYINGMDAPISPIISKPQGSDYSKENGAGAGFRKAGERN